MDILLSTPLIIICMLFALGLGITVIVSINSLISLKNSIKKAWANIDVLLKQRHTELPNLIETVKGYMKHEKTLLKSLAESRAAMFSAKRLSSKAAADERISESVTRIMALAENYPALRANENFLKLQERITGLENELADRREFYNDSVNNFNTSIQIFPGSIFASLLRFSPAEYFKAEPEDRSSIKAKF